MPTPDEIVDKILTDMGPLEAVRELTPEGRRKYYQLKKGGWRHEDAFEEAFGY